MRFADVRRAIAGLCMMAGVLSCADGLEPLSKVPAPAELTVEVAKLNSVRLSWTPVSGAEVVGYAIERRANLKGSFTPLVAQVPQSSLDHVVWLDTEVAAETYYGYRVYTITQFGDRSAPSVVGGTRTPSLPGIDIRTSSIVTSAGSIDPDGYDLIIAGPDTVRSTIGHSAARRFSPLRPGTYTVSLGGVIERCSVNGAPTRSVAVTDTLAETISKVAFDVTCRDPSRGEITVAIATTGTNPDLDHTIDLLGEADDATLPVSERIVTLDETIAGANGSTRFVNLRPGTYEITLEDLAPNCAVTGTTTRTVHVAALAKPTVTFNVVCTGDAPGGNTCPTCPFVLRNTWSAPSAAPGSRVKLTVELNLTAVASQTTQGVQADLFFDPSILRFEASTAGQLPVLTANTSNPGRISFIAAATSPKSGLIKVAEFEFTVIGAQGNATTTRTDNLKSGSPTGPIQAQIGIVEGTFTVGAGTGNPPPPTNQPPVARVNGPYAGTVGSAVAFSAANTADPDGAITGYAWNFGDGSTGSGSTTSHAYATAGTFTVVLTVTDDDGATDTDQTTVTVTGGGTPANQLPTARANGPYTATVGVPVALSSAGSIDPDGSIASYSWALGNGQTATGASPLVTYATAGTYTATLTVTDNRGGSASAQATVTVAPPVSTLPLVWRMTFGPVDVVNNLVAVTVTYDLRTDVPETPGIEVLKSFVVDSVKWNPALLQLYSINLGPNITGSSNQTRANAGNLAFQGSVSGAQAQGLITIATIRFKLVGTSGARAITATTLGTLLGAASTGNASYNAKTMIVEGEIIIP